MPRRTPTKALPLPVVQPPPDDGTCRHCRGTGRIRSPSTLGVVWVACYCQGVPVSEVPVSRMSDRTDYMGRSTQVWYPHLRGGQ